MGAAPSAAARRVAERRAQQPPDVLTLTRALALSLSRSQVSDMEFCFYRLHCGSMDTCEGNGARAAALGLAAALVAAAAALALLL